jgi:hypothetical protein
MTTDGGAWTLASSYDLTTKAFENPYATGLAEYLSKNIGTMEFRVEVETNQGRIYKVFFKNFHLKGNDYHGNTAWFAACKQTWGDAYTGDDWGLNEKLERPIATMHQEASNAGQNNWLHNVNSTCHNSMTSADGQRFTAQRNTYFESWNAYSGGLKISPQQVNSTGAGYNHGFDALGPEGQNNQPYSATISGMQKIRIWIK